MKNIKKIFYATLILIALPIQTISAHVKWFVPENEVEANFIGAPFYKLTDTAPLVWIGLAIVGLMIAWWLDKKVSPPKWLQNLGQKYQITLLRIFQFFVGLFLIAISVGWHVVLVPTLGGYALPIIVMMLVQGLIGVMLITNFYPKIAATSLALLYLVASVFGGWEMFFENILLFGISAYIYLNHTQPKDRLAKYKTNAQTILRISAGISLVVLAFTEKLIHPELSQYFLQEHHWNFMQNFGLNYPDNLFILSVAAMETIFGLILISGKITRIATLALAGFFAISVVSMLVGYGKWEVEDLVIYAAAISLLAYGSDK